MIKKERTEWWVVGKKIKMTVFECDPLDEWFGSNLYDTEKSKSIGFFKDSSPHHHLIPKYKVAFIFRVAGWLGDGEIEAFWVPHLFRAGNSSVAFIIYTVKQSKSGTTFIGSEEQFNRERGCAEKVSQIDVVFSRYTMAADRHWRDEKPTLTLGKKTKKNV